MNLTPEQLRQTAAAIEAFNAGDAVEFQTIDGDWIPIQIPPSSWYFIYDKGYRPAPKPAPPKPWDMNTCPTLPFEVLRKDKQVRTIVESATMSGLRLGGGFGASYNALLEEYTLSDGSPCGVTK